MSGYGLKYMYFTHYKIAASAAPSNKDRLRERNAGQVHIAAAIMGRPASLLSTSLDCRRSHQALSSLQKRGTAMTEIDHVLSQLTLIRNQLKHDRARDTDMLIYILEMALAEARDVREGVRRQLPKDR